MKLDGIWGGTASYPGKPYWYGIECCDRCHKTKAAKENPKQLWDQRVADLRIVLMTQGL